MLRSWILFSLSAVLGLPAGAAEPTAWSSLLADHAARYPGMEPQDAYKAVFQGVLGAEHAAPDEQTALTLLKREIAEMGEGPGEPLVDPISPDGAFVRVHLRPFAQRQGDAAALARAFVASARKAAAQREKIAAVWNEVVETAERGKLPFSTAVARDYGEGKRASGWPAVRHSSTFHEKYRPAYRVIARAFLAEALAGLK